MASALPDPYPSTPSFTPTPRFLTALSSFSSMHSTDPSPPPPSSSSSQPPSVDYHSTLEAYARKLSLKAGEAGDEELGKGPGEALLLACACQHVRRWERPRGDYAEGLSGYKMWRTALNKFHADIADEVLLSSGYDATTDAVLLARVRELLLKKTLNRPPLPKPEELKDPEAHLFEDAVCLTFLRLQFADFAAPYLSSSSTSSTSPSPSSPSAAPSPSPHVTPAKLAGIVAKTWAKMTPLGRGVAVEELVGGLPEDLKSVVVEAVSGVRDAWEQ